MRDTSKNIKLVSLLNIPSFLSSENKNYVRATEHCMRYFLQHEWNLKGENASDISVCCNVMSRDQGDLGNQLFQLAMITAIAKLHKINLKIPNADAPYYKSQGVKLNCFDIPKKYLHDLPLPTGAELHEQSFEIRSPYSIHVLLLTYVKTLLPKSSVTVEGFFQNYLTAKYVEEELRQLLTFKKNHLEKAEEFIRCLKLKHPGPIAYMHIRLGDQKDDEVNHPVLTKGYYDRAIENCKKLNPDTKFLIISDEPEDCKSVYKGPDFIYQDEVIDIIEDTAHRTEQDLKSYFSAPVDLCILSKADTLIIANSTFSWWGAWLAKDAKIYAPIRSRWFGEAFDWKSMSDFYPPDWEEVWFPHPSASRFNEDQEYMFDLGTTTPCISVSELGECEDYESARKYINEQTRKFNER